MSTGHYLFMYASSGWPGAQSVLQSAVIPGGNYCFEFYYYMNGQDIGGKVISILLLNTRDMGW